MPELINIYCDESCHLENDRKPLMVLGALWCEINKTRQINERIRQIKKDFNLNRSMEIKWTKVSPAKIDFYIALIRYFFSERALHYRGLIALQKDSLRHDIFAQDQESWYFKMYFNMLKIIVNPNNKYNIYLDIKDTKSCKKINKLRDVLCNNIYDFSREIIQKIQPVRSHEIEIIQLTDLINGALGYLHRNLSSSPAKKTIIAEIRKLSHYTLRLTTLAGESKFNLLIWTPQIIEEEQ